MVNSLNPFGNGHLLPRGTLRELPKAALRRADAVVLHHSDLAGSERMEGVQRQLAALSPRHALFLRTHMRPASLRSLIPCAGSLDMSIQKGGRVWVGGHPGCPWGVGGGGCWSGEPWLAPFARLCPLPPHPPPPRPPHHCCCCNLLCLCCCCWCRAGRGAAPPVAAVRRGGGVPGGDRHAAHGGGAPATHGGAARGGVRRVRGPPHVHARGVAARHRVSCSFPCVLLFLLLLFVRWARLPPSHRTPSHPPTQPPPPRQAGAPAAAALPPRVPAVDGKGLCAAVGLV